jgi:hypothetical protein
MSCVVKYMAKNQVIVTSLYINLFSFMSSNVQMFSQNLTPLTKFKC